MLPSSSAESSIPAVDTFAIVYSLTIVFFTHEGRARYLTLRLQPRWLLSIVSILSLLAGADNRQGLASCAMTLPSAAAASFLTHIPMKAIYMADAISKYLRGPNRLCQSGDRVVDRSNRALTVVPLEIFGGKNYGLMLPRIRSRNDWRRCWRMPRGTRMAS